MKNETKQSILPLSLIFGIVLGGVIFIFKERTPEKIKPGDVYLFTFDKHCELEPTTTHTVVILSITDSSVKYRDIDFIMDFEELNQMFYSHSKKCN